MKYHNELSLGAMKRILLLHRTIYFPVPNHLLLISSNALQALFTGDFSLFTAFGLASLLFAATSSVLVLLYIPRSEELSFVEFGNEAVFLLVCLDPIRKFSDFLLAIGKSGKRSVKYDSGIEHSDGCVAPLIPPDCCIEL